MKAEKFILRFLLALLYQLSDMRHQPMRYQYHLDPIPRSAPTTSHIPQLETTRVNNIIQEKPE